MDEKLAGLAHRMNIVLGQPQASHRNFQSRHWADLRKLGPGKAKTSSLEEAFRHVTAPVEAEDQPHV